MLSSKKDSATVRVLESIKSLRLIPIYNDEILAEYKDVLSRKKFKFDMDIVNSLVNKIKNSGFSMSRTEFEEQMPDEKDRVFYEVSLTNDSYLVTGNKKHFPITPKVVTPSEMMNIIDNINT